MSEHEWESTFIRLDGCPVGCTRRGGELRMFTSDFTKHAAHIVPTPGHKPPVVAVGGVLYLVKTVDFSDVSNRNPTIAIHLVRYYAPSVELPA